MKVKTPQPRVLRKRLTNEYLNSLPLHKLLAIAMRDLRKQERAKNSEVCMFGWLVFDFGKCQACAAGSILRWSCGKKTEMDLRGGLDKWIVAVNCVRKGRVGSALMALGRGCCDDFNKYITDYYLDRAAFWRDISKLRRDLKAVGI